MPDNELKNRKRKILRNANPLISASIGSSSATAIGFFLGGPAGSILASAVSPVFARAIERIFDDILNRTLSSQEEIRVGASIVICTHRIEERIALGHKVRDDLQDVDTVSGRRKSEEVLEGSIIKCKSEHESNKVKYISNIFANYVFESDIDAESANWILNYSEDFTYTQLILISLLERQDEFNVDLSDYRLGGWENCDSSAYQFLRAQLYNLGSEGKKLTTFTNAQRQWVRPFLTDMGKVIYSIMGLETIPESDIHRILGQLQEYDPKKFS